jgi:hypothetical protein
MKERTVQVINVPADILHAYTPLTSLSENFQYLLVVTHVYIYLPRIFPPFGEGLGVGFSRKKKAGTPYSTPAFFLLFLNTPD